jgi:hypothetical protein
MGCDIHMYTEIKRTIDNKPQWVNSDRWVPNPYYLYGGEDEKQYERPWDLHSIYGGRNYELFSVLANVRGYGPAILEPRGLPDDICMLTNAENDKWASDGHSHSYFTLRELVEYYNNNPHRYVNAYISREDANKLDEEGIIPEDLYCVDDEDKVYREWKMDSLIKPLIDKLKLRYKDELYTWPDNQTMEDHEKIRIVFWFDN